MKIEKIVSQIVLDLVRLNEDIIAVIPKVIGVIGYGSTVYKINLSEALTGEEDAQLDGIISNFVDSDPELKVPKIYDIAKMGEVEKHFHCINYKTGIDGSLFPKRTSEKGEVTKVEYFRDEALTDLYLIVDIVYNRDGLGTALDRTTTRSWINRDQSINMMKKENKKLYTINLEDQTKEGKRRRGNIVDGIEYPTLALMMEVLLPLGHTQNSVLNKGKDFLDEYEVEFNKFIKNSSDVTDPADINFGKKSIVVALENVDAATHDWIDKAPASIGGMTTIRNYLIGEFSI